MFCVETESSSLLRTQKTLVHNARARLHATSLIDAVGREAKARERKREREREKEDDAFFFFLRKKKKTTKKKKKDTRFGIEE